MSEVETDGNPPCKLSEAEAPVSCPGSEQNVVTVKTELVQCSSADTPLKASEASTKFFPALFLPSEKIHNEQAWVLPQGQVSTRSENTFSSNAQLIGVGSTSGQQLEIKGETGAVSTCDMAQLVLAGFIASAQSKDQKPLGVECDTQDAIPGCDTPKGKREVS